MLHVGAIAIVLLLNMPVWSRMFLIPAVLISLHQTVMLHAWRRGNAAIAALRLMRDGGVFLREQRSRTWRSASIDSRFVYPKLVLLRARSPGRRFASTVIITAAMVEPDVFRRLRARLLAPPRESEA